MIPATTIADVPGPYLRASEYRVRNIVAVLAKMRAARRAGLDRVNIGNMAWNAVGNAPWALHGVVKIGCPRTGMGQYLQSLALHNRTRREARRVLDARTAEPMRRAA